MCLKVTLWACKGIILIASCFQPTIKDGIECLFALKKEGAFEVDRSCDRRLGDAWGRGLVGSDLVECANDGLESVAGVRIRVVGISGTTGWPYNV